MANSDLKPWFREDIARVLISAYFTMKSANPRSSESSDFRIGFASALSSVAINVGINPQQILASEDFEAIQNSIGLP